MNRFGNTGGNSRGNMDHRGSGRYYNSYPRYNSGGLQSDSEEGSSTHSVRVSRLIEKIKSQQQLGSRAGYVPSPGDFNYFNRGELIYSRVERGDREGGNKRTVRERVLSRDTTPLHKTTVLLNNEDSGGDTSGDYSGGLYSQRYERGRNNNNGSSSRGSGPGFSSGARYFGQETDYEEDRYLSMREREGREAKTRFAGRDVVGGGLSGGNVNRNSSVPKIILHEEAVAEIPNGRIAGTRSPSMNRDVTTDDEFHEKGNSKGSRFLGGLLTLKRGKKERGGSSVGGGTIRSVTRSPSRTAGSYLNVPGERKRDSVDNANDSSSSPKYYVPYHRSTPTLYESKYERDRMSSAGGSVLSNGSYVAKNVSRSMSMKAPWEPRHRVNEINYYNEMAKGKEEKVEDKVEQKKRTNLSRSKSMPGKKLTSLIGSWVSKGTLKRQSNGAEKSSKEKIVEDDHERLIGKGGKQAGNQAVQGNSGGGKWGTLLRFGKGGKKGDKGEGKGVNNPGRTSPERPVRGKKAAAGKGEESHNRNEYSSRSSVSPIRVGGGGNRNVYAGGERTGTLLRNSSSYERSKRGNNSGGGRGFY